MKKMILFSLLMISSIHAEMHDDHHEKNNHAWIRNYQTINESTYAILSHKQAISDVTSAMHANFNALQKFQVLLQEQQEVFKNNAQAIEQNQAMIALATMAIQEHAEAVQEVRKMEHLFKRLPLILFLFLALVLIPTVVMLWALLDLKKTLKKK